MRTKKLAIPAPRTFEGRVRPTLNAVAERAGVSKSLASRVLNGGSLPIPISQETIRRIKESANDLLYIPSRLARSLSNGARSHIIGLSVLNVDPVRDPATFNEFSRPLPEEMQNPIVAELRKVQRNSEIGLIINEIAQNQQLRGKWDVVVRHRNESAENPLTPIDLGLDLVEGLIYFQPTSNHLEILEYSKAGIPIVIVGNISIEHDVCSVGIHNRQCGFRITEHLLKLGRRQLAGLWPFSPYVQLAALRHQGFELCLKEHGLSPVDEIFGGSNSGIEVGYWLMRSLLDHFPNIDGLVCGTNTLARGAAYAIQSTGRRIPDDVAVVTFDDNLLNLVEKPNLTALKVPSEEMVHLALHTLIQMIEKKPVEVVHQYLEPKLTIRESCGAAIPDNQDIIN